VPAAVVIPALLAYDNVAAVKTLVVGVLGVERKREEIPLSALTLFLYALVNSGVCGKP